MLESTGRLIREVRNRHLGLYLVGGLNLALALVFLALAPFDSRTVTGLGIWLKPFKFAVSVGIYLWTIAWFLPRLRVPKGLAQGLGWAIAGALFFENSLVFSQAFRGTSSHFNITTMYDAAVFSSMGILIAINTVLAFVLLILFFVRPGDGPRAYLWGIRLGLLLLLLGSAQGGMIIANGAHTVGQDDGGPGLPALGWSTEAGDLRPAHMVFLHALQLVPLAGYWVSRKNDWTVRRQTMAVFAFAALYAAVGILLQVQALAGRPLISI